MGRQSDYGLNVRSSPRVGARVIAWLRKGQGITVNGEEENWYKIVFDVEGKGNREGWVNSHYIESAPLEKAKGDLSSELAKIRAKIASEESRQKIPLGASTAEVRLSKGMEREPEKDSIPIAANAFEKQTPMVPREGLPVGKNDRKDTPPEEAFSGAEKAQEVSPSEFPVSEREGGKAPAPPIATVARERGGAIFQIGSPVPEMEKSAAPAPLAGASEFVKKPEAFTGTIVPAGEKSRKQEPTALSDGRRLNDAWTFKDLARLALRLLTVVLSCVAILFSYKAINLAKISYDTAMQFTSSLQVRRQ